VITLLLCAAVAAPHLGEAAPPFDLPPLAGSAPARTTRRQPTVVAFFASWCEPCRDNLADLGAIRESLGPHFRLVIVAEDRDPARVRAYFDEHPPPPGTTVLLDSDNQAARRWGEDRLPTSFFLDRSAVIRHINRGHGTGFRARATAWLRAMFDDA
jgi:thiol-disulfide isomerase/thioredoxin